MKYKLFIFVLLLSTFFISIPTVKAQVKYEDVVEKIMKQPGCVGVRMYYGKPVSGKSRVVIVGYGKNGREIASSNFVGPDLMCPPMCE